MNNKNHFLNYGYTKLNSFFSTKYIDDINNIIDNLNLKSNKNVFEESNTGKIKQIQYLYKYNKNRKREKRQLIYSRFFF